MGFSIGGSHIAISEEQELHRHVGPDSVRLQVDGFFPRLVIVAGNFVGVKGRRTVAVGELYNDVIRHVPELVVDNPDDDRLLFSQSKGGGVVFSFTARSEQIKLREFLALLWRGDYIRQRAD